MAQHFIHLMVRLASLEMTIGIIGISKDASEHK